jgi:hypothetical protein
LVAGLIGIRFDPMVPPQPRLPVRRPSKGGRAVGLTAAVAVLAALLVVALGPVLPTPLKGAVNQLRGYPAWRRRVALGPEAPPFGGPAASQVGYGPSMVKQFPSPSRFASFHVVSASGEVVFRGGPPVREVPTDALGAVRTVWVGDLTPLRGPGRYRVVTDDGISSHPFDVGPGVFDSAVRAVQALGAKGDPLEMIARVAPFEGFRAEIEAAVLTPVSENKSTAGRKPIDVVVIFRMLVLQSLYNLSDEQVEYQVRDRLSFKQFLGLGIEDDIPDGTTLWLFREDRGGGDLWHNQLLPEDRLAELMVDLFGIRLVAATIARMSRTCAARLQDFVTAVRDLVAGAPVKHTDETGFRIGGQTQWLHVACTAWLTFYRVCARRGSLLADVVGIVVHDHWKPYYTIPGVLHALCNVHHLRELKALVEIEKEDWARKMQQLLRRACHAANLARKRGNRRSCPLPRREIPTPWPQAAPHWAQSSPASHKQDVLRFLNDLAVPFTNNQAKHDACMMKVKQKISGGFRCIAGATDFATIRSFITTAEKQARNIIQTIAQEPKVLVISASPDRHKASGRASWAVTSAAKTPSP